jgi:hypothetical protein
MLSQFERERAALVNMQSPPVQTVVELTSNVQNVQNIQINNITYLNINSTRVREEKTQTILVNGILVYRDDTPYS